MSYCFEEKCWCHDFYLEDCPVVNLEEPTPELEWDDWNCPQCGLGIVRHRSENKCTSAIDPDYLARPWIETQGDVTPYFKRRGE